MKGIEELPDYSKVSFPSMESISLHVLLPTVHTQDIEFIEKILILNPAVRPTANQVNDLMTF